MASRAYIDLHIATLGRVGVQDITAMALDLDRLVFRMDSFFHDIFSSLPWLGTGPKHKAGTPQGKAYLLTFKTADRKPFLHSATSGAQGKSYLFINSFDIPPYGTLAAPQMFQTSHP
jgi:hypothetical protein